MGVVFKAHDPVIGRSVAVKTMRLTPEGTGMTRDELIARFQTEARAAGLLSHPNIVVVYDAGEDEGLFYITMEYVEGRSLQALLDAGQSFPLPRVLRLMEQACSALEYAHQRNVVHRDIKPANLMLTADDTVKVTDFGTAKILQFGTAQTAQVIGTPSYMSPEQVKGKLVDGRSDIFSLGVILYELVTGEKPFPGQNITTVIYKIINEDPIPPRVLDSSVHPGLSAVITRALAKDPAARFASCRELMEAVRSYREFTASPEATVVMAADASGRSTARPRPSAAAEHQVRVAESQPQKKRGSLLLALFLLAVIGFACYRIWPYARDVWERSRAALAERAPAGGQPNSHDSAAPALPDAPPPATNPAPETLPAPHEERPTEGKPEGTSPTAKPSAPRPGPPVNAPAAALKARIEQQLAAAGLSDKVRLAVAGNTLTLLGRLTTQEHRQLLQLLRDAPSWAQLVDHIEYASRLPVASGAQQPAQPAAERGEMDVFTNILGAAAVLRGPQGRVVSACRTPCQFKDLWPGRYMLEVNLAGYQPIERVLQVRAGGNVEARLELLPAFTGLLVTSRPQQARIFLNGQLLPDATPTTLRLDPGTYDIVLRKPGFEPYSKQVLIKSNEPPTQLDIELVPGSGGSGAAGEGAGGILVATTPPGAQILVDGFSVRQRTPARLSLPPGEHTLTFALKGFTVARRTIMVEADQPQQINVPLR